eukprot:167719-Pyramimonas_sp.AAC.1
MRVRISVGANNPTQFHRVCKCFIFAVDCKPRAKTTCGHVPLNALGSHRCLTGSPGRSSS